MLFPTPLVAAGGVFAEEVGILVVAAGTAALLVASFQQEGWWQVEVGSSG